MGACGLETRCCSLFLTDFSSISIRMAKEQNISLTPAEITGMCGRLRCCLIYEYEQYVAARKELPKRNKRVITPQGEGRVVDTIVLSGRVIVEIPEIGRREFGKEEIEPADELERLQNKAKNPCGDGDGSGGNCGGACGH
jgi:cell fate regulator YaaT (PSP1 superfamily)